MRRVRNASEGWFRRTLEADRDAERFAKRNERDIVVLCGSPGVGKSTFYWTEIEPHGYERVNQDILKSVSVASPARFARQKAELASVISA